MAKAELAVWIIQRHVAGPCGEVVTQFLCAISVPGEHFAPTPIMSGILPSYASRWLERNSSVFVVIPRYVCLFCALHILSKKLLVSEFLSI